MIVFEQLNTDGIAELSYLVGDTDTGTAAVIDPRADVDIYLKAARRHGLTITHIFETHIHADLVSGSRELRDRLGAGRIFASSEGGAEYEFPTDPLHDGDTFQFGKLRLTACHTPGHTPEHMAYLLTDSDHPDRPWGVLSGDAFFVGSAGRPDLLGSGQAKDLSRKQYDTLYHFFCELDDGVLIYPAHGAGSPCGASIGDRLVSTVGFEKATNDFLQFDKEDDFVEYALETAPPEPTYYQRMKKENAQGPEILGGLPPCPGITPESFQELVASAGHVLIDTRSAAAFGGNHISGALNIGGAPILSVWSGWMLDPEAKILLVLDSDDDLERIQRLFIRTGLRNFGGYLVGGMSSWVKAGLPVAQTAQCPVHDLRNGSNEVELLDVRTPEEWDKGRIPGAQHFFLPELRERLDELDREAPVVTYCNSGYRASLAASILQQHGFADVAIVPGSWQAWQKAGYPIETNHAPKSEVGANHNQISENMKSKELTPDLTVGGQPTREEIQSLPEKGFKTLINLRSAGEEDQPLSPDEERQVAENAKLRYHHLPVDPENMSEQDVDHFRRVLADTPAPVFVHCRTGKRAGAFSMMHLAVEHGQSGEEVLEKAEQMGFECDSEDLREFVVDYIDSRRAAMVD